MIQQMTAMRIAADKEKEQRHETPLFPCSVYVTDWQRGSIEGCPWHWHKDLELMYLAAGSVQVECSGQQTVLREGDGLFFNSKVLHRYQVVGDEPCHVYYLIFILWYRMPAIPASFCTAQGRRTRGLSAG